MIPRSWPAAIHPPISCAPRRSSVHSLSLQGMGSCMRPSPPPPSRCRSSLVGYISGPKSSPTHQRFSCQPTQE
eukprot:scaffold1786_cov398-Prasinococcus_capsulatus_cf.AAC.25